MQINVLHEPTTEEPFVVVDKIPPLPTAPLKDGDESVLTEIGRIFPSVLSVQGRKPVEHGLIHRIDNDTRGIVLLAASQSFYDELIEKQKCGLFEKWYSAKVDSVPDCGALLGGFPEKVQVRFGSSEIISSFRYYGVHNASVRPVTESCGKAALKKSSGTVYKTEITVSENLTAVCHITAGFRHQVRCHLAWCGYPVHGDKLYNPLFKDGEKLCFTASKISFPYNGNSYSFSLDF